MKINNKYLFLFVLGLLGVALHFNYQKTTFEPPGHLHKWRQSDVASIALNYYEGGMHFFQPRVHNRLNHEGFAAGEFPGLYYLTALSYKIFGVKDFILRLINLFFFGWGMIALFRVVFRFTGDYFSAFVIPLFFFSSPLIAYFANNFLSDAPSVGCVFIGWSFLLQYRDRHDLLSFWYSMCFFALAALLKVNSMICFLSVAAMFFIELNNWGKLREEGKLFIHLKHNLAGFAAVCVLTATWYAWAIAFNHRHGVSFFGTGAWPGWPIWEASAQDMLSTFSVLFNELKLFFSLPVLALLVFLLFFVTANLAKLPVFLKGLFILIFSGVTIFFFTFFVGFREQIYYFVNPMIFPVLVLITGAVIFQKKYPVIYSSIVFRILVVVLLIANIDHAKATLHKFYDGENPLNENFYRKDFRTFIDSAGIQKQDLVISIPDQTPNATLYLINRKGWSNYGFPGGTVEQESLEAFIKTGAKYLILNDTSLRSSNKTIELYTSHPVAHYNNIFVYRLHSKQVIRNISLRAYNGKYVGANLDKPDMPVLANKDYVGHWETFHMIENYGGSVWLKAYNNKYISADFGKNGVLNADREKPFLWETFIVQKLSPGKVALKADNGKYVHVTDNNALVASADTTGEKEIFELTNISD